MASCFPNKDKLSGDRIAGPKVHLVGSLPLECRTWHDFIVGRYVELHRTTESSESGRDPTVAQDDACSVSRLRNSPKRSRRGAPQRSCVFSLFIPRTLHRLAAV